MNVEIGTEAAQFPEKEYIKGIFVAMCTWTVDSKLTSCSFIDSHAHLCPLPLPSPKEPLASPPLTLLLLSHFILLIKKSIMWMNECFVHVN